MNHNHKHKEQGKDSISLSGAVAMGTGVMIGAGIFALTGQVAELAGQFFPFAFIVGAIIASFSAYSYIKMSNAWPSSGGVAMILQKCYGTGAIAGGAALLMALSMVIAESLVARTFASYVLRPFDISGGPLVPIISVGVILFAFAVNLAGNRSVGLLSSIMAVIKIGGISLFAIAALYSSGLQFSAGVDSTTSFSLTGFVASVALTILAFKGFTTITNSGSEVTNPHRNIGLAIIISIVLCAVVYVLVTFAVGSSLSIEAIIIAKDYSLAEAAKPALGRTGFYLTIALAAVATLSGVLASVFAVSRMLAMMTDMKMIPHSHFGMSGSIRKHTLVYAVVIASLLAVFFDIGRIASLGAFLYIVMDMVIQWGVYRHMRHEIDAAAPIILAALAFDAIVLVALTMYKIDTDPLIVVYAVVAIVSIFAYERFYLSKWHGKRPTETSE
jgi:amino acid transporter